jgi:prophage maintenance system killer protein/prophage antirepressor-like protein
MQPKKEIKEKNIVIYKGLKGSVSLRAQFDKETIWATLNQIADLFGVQKAAISKHFKNIFETSELNKKTTVSILETVQIEGSKKKLRKIEYYNLDGIIAVGYRVNSKQATQFRIWATETLRKHVTLGYTINKNQISKNYDSFMKSVSEIQSLLPEHVVLDPKTILELIKEFASTWVSLDAYDKEKLKIVGYTKKSIKLTGDELMKAIQNLKHELIKKDEATLIFAQEREKDSITGIVGNVMQSFGGKMLYQTLEEKAAHLLYFIVKNHPFVDGNKRSGAFAFIWFLRKARVKGMKNMNPATLTALTLLIAESNPNKKDQMIALITQLLK